MNKDQQTVDQIREFNRFYTTLIGTLNQHFLDSDFTLTETRILFEISSQQACPANYLVNLLGIDRSYMCRIVRSFEKKGLITRRPSLEDKRVSLIALTEHGHASVQTLIQSTNEQISTLVAPLSDEDKAKVVSAMDVIREKLDINQH